MGSSKVIICASLILLISFIIAAKVVLLPDPVGPVTKTSPLLLLIISLNKLMSYHQIVLVLL